jgi:hypothetical protein
MVTWGILLVFLAFRKQLKAFAVYLVVAIANVGLYLNNYHPVAGHTPIHLLFSNQLDFFRYISLYLGGSISNDDQVAPLLGAITIAIFLILGIKAVLERQTKSYFWLAIASFVLVNAMITGSGRFSLGPEQALASRYTSFSLLWLLSIVTLSSSYIYKAATKRSEWLQAVSISVTVVLFAIFTVNSLGGVTASKAYRIKNQSASECLNASNKPHSSCFSLVYPSNPITDNRNTQYLMFLRGEHLAGR